MRQATRQATRRGSPFRRAAKILVKKRGDSMTPLMTQERVRVREAAVAGAVVHDA
jgi:hypothetical protein